MLKRLITVSVAALVAVALSVGAAFAAWRVEFRASGASNLGTDVDDIAENYSFNEGSRKYVPDRYTIYLFPSTLYLQSYLDYLDGKTTVKPEELYGHIFPEREEDGAPKTDGDGNVLYGCSQTGGDDGYLNDWVADKGAYSGDYLISDEKNRSSFYDDVYKKSNWLAETGAETYAYGDPVYDLTEADYTGVGTGQPAQHNNRNMHRYDRFGFWSTVRKDEGRYLPLKIEVDEKFSPDFYEQVVKRPLSDMGDPRNWYCYSFTLWSYVATDETGYNAPFYATDGFLNNLSNYNNVSLYGKNGSINPALSAFCPTTVSQYFDLMGDMSVYADDDGVIRLFPKFSNGKSYDEYSSSTDSSDLPQGFHNGANDAIRLTPTYAEENALVQRDFYMSYLSEYTEYNGVTGLAVATLTNVALADFSAMTVEADITTKGFSTWPGKWTSLVDLSGDNLKNIVTGFGEGFYNIYVFLGYVGQTSKDTPADNPLTNLVSDISKGSRVDEKGIFSSLRGKNLQQPTENGEKNYWVGYVTVDSVPKPYAVAIEKVRDTRIIMNLSRDSSTQSGIREGYASTNQYFKYLSNNVYAVTAGSADKIDIKNTTPINQKYQYCYLLSGVDFTNTNTPYFQIRFQKRYRDDLVFHGVDGVKKDGAEGGDYSPDVDLIFNPSKEDGSFEKEQRFINAFGNYFTASVTTVENDVTDENVTEQQIMFSLKNEEYKGIYDILIIYIPNEFYTVKEGGATVIKYDSAGLTDYVTHRAGFYMFAYRQTNVFLKILANNPSQQGGNGFLEHGGGDFAEDNILIFQKEYALGVSVKGDDDNEEAAKFTGGYASYPHSAIGWSLTKCMNEFVGKYLETKGVSVDKVVIRDHVTNAIVGYYVKASADEVAAAPEGYYYEENGSYWGLKFENFRVRKNYVFYITTINL